MSECGCRLDGDGCVLKCAEGRRLCVQAVNGGSFEMRSYESHLFQAGRAAALPAPPSDHDLVLMANGTDKYRTSDHRPAYWTGFYDGARRVRDQMLQRRPQPEPSTLMLHTIGPSHEQQAARVQESAQRAAEAMRDVVDRDFALKQQPEAWTVEAQLRYDAEQDAMAQQPEPSGSAPTDAEVEAALETWRVEWHQGRTGIVTDPSSLAVAIRAVRWAWEQAPRPAIPTADEVEAATAYGFTDATPSLRDAFHLGVAWERAARPAAVELGDREETLYAVRGELPVPIPESPELAFNYGFRSCWDLLIEAKLRAGTTAPVVDLGNCTDAFTAQWRAGDGDFQTAKIWWTRCWEYVKARPAEPVDPFETAYREILDASVGFYASEDPDMLRAVARAMWDWKAAKEAAPR